jgi:hypothetical protein
MNNFTLKDNSLSYDYQKENEIKYFKRLYDYLKKINFDVIEFGEEFEYSYENVFDYDYNNGQFRVCLLYTSPSPRDRTRSRMPSSA